MQGLAEYQSPLYGRAQPIIHLEPMDYFDSAKFYPDFSYEDKIRLYSVFGGIPYYNTLIDPTLSVRENILRLVVSRNAYLGNELMLLLLTEMTKVNNANLVFEALAGGVKKFSDVLAQSKISSSPALADILNRLVNMGLVVKETPINDLNNPRRANYRIQDHLANFHYKYVQRHHSYMSVMTAEDFFEMFVAQDFETKHVPKVFEEIVRQFLIRKNLLRQIKPPFFQIGKFYFDLPKERRNGEFDVVTQDKLGYVCYEAKFKKQPMTKAQMDEEIGQVLASPLEANRFGFVSRSGFEAVEPREDLILYSLEDLFDAKLEKNPCDH